MLGREGASKPFPARHVVLPKEVRDLSPDFLVAFTLSVSARLGVEHRSQPLLDEVAALRAWLKERPADGSDALFTSQKGGALCREQFSRVFQAAAETAGLPAEGRHPHMLKNSLAGPLVAGNVNLALIKQGLWHRSTNSTMFYIGTSDSRAAQAVQSALRRIL